MAGSRLPMAVAQHAADAGGQRRRKPIGAALHIQVFVVHQHPLAGAVYHHSRHGGAAAWPAPHKRAVHALVFKLAGNRGAESIVANAGGQRHFKAEPPGGYSSGRRHAAALERKAFRPVLLRDDRQFVQDVNQIQDRRAHGQQMPGIRAPLCRSLLLGPPDWLAWQPRSAPSPCPSPRGEKGRQN